MTAKKLFILIVLSSFYLFSYGQNLEQLQTTMSSPQDLVKYPKDRLYLKPTLSDTVYQSPYTLNILPFIDIYNKQVNVPTGDIHFFLNGRDVSSKIAAQNPINPEVETVTSVNKPNTIDKKLVSRDASKPPLPIIDIIREGTYELGLLENIPNEIRIIYSNNSQKIDTTFYLTYINPYRKPNLHLITISTDYKGDTHNKELISVKEDAEQIARLFEQKGNTLYKKINTINLHNSKATEIASTLMNLESQPHDLAIIYIAAHGEKDKIKLYGYTENGNREASIAKEDLEKYLNNIDCKTLLMLDVCYGSHLIQSLNFDNKSTTTSFTFLSNPTDNFVKYPDAKIAIASAHGRAWEIVNHQQSVFVKTLNAALSSPKSDKNKDGYLSLQELGKFIQKQMPIEIKNIDPEVTQKPNVSKIGKTDFPLFKFN